MSIIFFLPLTKGEVALVDEDTYLKESQYKWTLKETKYKKYAYRQHLQEDKLVQVLLHRAITGCPKGKCVDHINGNGLDNRRVNLRICTPSQNLSNINAHKDKKYPLPKGVGFKKDRKTNPYVAQIMQNGKMHYLGVFPTAEEAHLAYKIKAIELYGEFAKY